MKPNIWQRFKSWQWLRTNEARMLQGQLDQTVAKHTTETRENLDMIKELTRKIQTLQSEREGIFQGFSEEGDAYEVTFSRSDGGYTVAHIEGTDLSFDTREFETLRTLKSYVWGAIAKHSGKLYPIVTFKNEE